MLLFDSSRYYDMKFKQNLIEISCRQRHAITNRYCQRQHIDAHARSHALYSRNKTCRQHIYAYTDARTHTRNKTRRVVYKIACNAQNCLLREKSSHIQTRRLSRLQKFIWRTNYPSKFLFWIFCLAHAKVRTAEMCNCTTQTQHFTQ